MPEILSDSSSSNNSDKLSVSLLVPILTRNNTTIETVSFVPISGALEKLFIDKLPQRPYTWIAQVLCASLKELDGTQLALPCREDYIKSGSITIPQVIKNLPLAIANTLLMEVHRKLWENEVKNQESLCKFCGSNFILDINLDNLDFDATTSDKVVEQLDLQGLESFYVLTAKLKNGLTYQAPKMLNGKQTPLSTYDGIVFTDLTFTVPTLGNAINHEKHTTDTTLFWQKIALDCLCEVKSQDNLQVLPTEAYKMQGIRFWQKFSAKDLKQIRGLLRDSFPTLPFTYKEECPKCHRETDVAVEGNGFFSD